MICLQMLILKALFFSPFSILFTLFLNIIAQFEDGSKMPKIQRVEIISNSLADVDPIRRRSVRRNVDGFQYQNNSTGCQEIIASPVTAAVRSQRNDDDDDVLSLPPSSETEEENPYAHLRPSLFHS